MKKIIIFIILIITANITFAQSDTLKYTPGTGLTVQNQILDIGNSPVTTSGKLTIDSSKKTFSDAWLIPVEDKELETITPVGRYWKQTDMSETSFEIVYSDFKTALESIAANLKVGAEHVYAILVKQQIVKSIYYIILLIASLFILLIAFNWFNWLQNDFKDWKINRKQYDSDEYFHWKIAIGILFTIAGIIGLSGAIANFDIILTGLINPEFGAIEEITKFIKH